MLKLTVNKEVEIKIPKKFFTDILKSFEKIMQKRIEKFLDNRNGEIDLVLSNDLMLLALNKEYRGKNQTTDVISFAYLEVTEYKKVKGDIIVGDIFISVDTAMRQAEKAGHSLKDELKILFVHGLLHLFGFDHKTDKQEKEMEKWARKVLKN